jgi:isopenicillin-N epimerase
MSEAQGLRLRAHWAIDPDIAFLNHGSFGACPISVLDHQSELRARLERDPVRFMVDDLEPMLDAARAQIGPFLGAHPQDLAFVPNATAGVNAVVRSLDLHPGDELLTTDHAYNACANALRFVAERTGARVVIARIPIPVATEDQLVDPILRALSPRTRLVMLDAITSPTAIVFPVARLVREIQSRGVDVLLDAAHAAGMIDLRLDDLGAAYTTGNFHKWTCAPKGAGFLHVRRDRQHLVRPAIISHGANASRTDRSRYLLEFDWTGTADPTPYLCVPVAIRAVGAMLPGAWPAIRDHNRAAAIAQRTRIADALGLTPVAPDAMIGSIASLMLPDAAVPTEPLSGNDVVHATLQNDFSVQVPVFPWPAPPRRLIRISAHLHNRPSDYTRLIDALRAILPDGTRG